MITESNQIEFRHLRYFLAVAESLHFRKAAEQLYISQPGLSRQIQELETTLGVKLFERNNRKVVRTIAGEYLFREVKQTFLNLENMFRTAKLLNEGIEGNLKLGYVGSAMQQVIPTMMLKFRQSHPATVFNLKEMENQRQIECLLNQEIDLGFVRLEKAPQDLILKPVLEETFSLVVPENHPVNERNFKSLSQFEKDNFIMFDQSYSAAYYEMVMRIFDHFGFRPIISHSTIHASAVFRLIENNFGVSIVPTSLQYGYNLKIRFIELKNIPHRAVLSMAWNCNNKNPMLKNFISENGY